MSSLRKSVYNFRMEGSRAKWWLENMRDELNRRVEHWSEEGRAPCCGQQLIGFVCFKWQCWLPASSWNGQVTPLWDRAALQESPDLVIWKICPASFYNQTDHKENSFPRLHLETFWNFEAKNYQVMWTFLRFPHHHIEKLVLILNYFTHRKSLLSPVCI